LTAKIVKLPVANAPPRKLGRYGTELWQRVTVEFVIEDASGIELLTLACQALDRAESCSEQISETGELIKVKNGFRENPLCKVELANRAFITRTLARLGLEHEPQKAIGRPPSPLGWKGN
jgi:hypothetical protein